MVTQEQQEKRKPPSSETKLTAEDFSFDTSGNLIINIEKVVQVMDYQAVNVKREPLKGGVSPI
ncbi:MAG: hypothetical protein SAK29_37900 [Scytonema sp. PMC 1069.18]|nr:hypothetical protein [Scytonema sp. PMC 1069.18]MEC4885491.1 hypothetical protein [Scytonema sp. PMC 1070.18]